MRPTSLRSTRVVFVLAALLAATAHVPVIPDHLRDAPYMGVLFVLFTAACLAFAAAMWVRPSAGVAAAALALCSSGIAVYLLTRLVPFPQLADDVGNWGEPLGLVSIATEAVAAGAAAQLWAALRRRRPAGTPRTGAAGA